MNTGRFLKGPAKTLKYRLYNMVKIPAVMKYDMQVHPGMV
jgi:hypothetical protein